MKLRHKRLHLTLVSSYLIIIIIFVFMLSIFTFSYFSKMFETKVRENNDLSMTIINNKLESIFDSYRRITSNGLALNMRKDIFDLLAIKDIHSWEFIQLRKNVFESISFFAHIGNPVHIKRIYISRQDHSVVSAIPTEGDALYNYIKNQRLDSSSSNQFNRVSIDNEQYLLVSQKISHGSSKGTIFIFFNYKSFKDAIDTIIEDSDSLFYIFNSNDNIIYTSQNKTLQDPSINTLLSIRPQSGQSKDYSYLYNYYYSSKTGWHIVSAFPRSNLESHLFLLRIVIILVSMAATVLSLVISLSISQSIMRPIKKFVYFSNEVTNGNYLAKIDVDSYSELNYLAETLNIMSTKLDTTIKQFYLLKIKQQEAELNLLYSKINPHFLYNTLNSINLYAKFHKIPEISNMTCSLSNMFRYSLENKLSLVTLSKELDHINDYLYIQNIRFGDEITYTLNISPCFYCYKTIPFILQPLIENALQHGFEHTMSTHSKMITLSAFIENDTLSLLISDNGCGFPKKTLAHIQTLLSEPSHTSPTCNSKHIGLLNIHQRLLLQFGPSYGLVIKSTPGNGCTIQVKMPCLKA